MAKPLRIQYEGATYHVTARGNERGKIFFTKKDYERFKEYIATARIKFGVALQDESKSIDQHRYCGLTLPRR